MSKPEVVAIAFPSEAFEGAEGVGLNDYASRVGVTCPTELIRLTDHERLQAETERLQAASAADKSRIEELTDLCDRLKQEAQIQAQEARTANATIAEIYRIVSGGKGEPGNWNGAEPVRKRIAELEAERKEVRDLLKAMFPKHVVESLAALAQQGKDGET